jgi:hypothetical protein
MRNKLILVILFSLVPRLSWGAFSETSRRYLAPRDIFNVLQQKFPVLNKLQKAKLLKPACYAVGPGNTGLIGAVNPAVGTPAADLPVTGFVRWLGTCGRDIVDLQFKELKEKPKDGALWEKYFPKAFLDKYRDQMDTATWSSVTLDDRRMVLRHQIESLIGPEPVVTDLGFAKDLDELIMIAARAAATDPSATIAQAAQKTILSFVLREEFISY